MSYGGIDRTWYRISHANGGRLYIVECRECKQTWTTGAHSMSDEAMRKRYLRDGWNLGRRANQNLCPHCSNKHAQAGTQSTGTPQPHHPPAQPVQPAQPFLIDAWLCEPESGRKAFLHWFAAQPAGIEFRGVLDKPAPGMMIKASTLKECWDQASKLERNSYADMHRGPVPTLESLWKQSSTEQRAQFVHLMLDLQELLEYVTLGSLWQIADLKQRNALLNYLEQATLLKPRNQSLWDHWKAAPPKEREAIEQHILAAHLHKLQPDSAPDRPATIAHPAVNRADIPGTIRKVDFAAEIGVVPSTISKYLERGMPCRDDGLLDKEAALAWVAEWKRAEQARLRPTQNNHQHVETEADEAIAFTSLDDDDAIAALSAKLFGH